MKLSRLKVAVDAALEKFGDLEINARYLPGDNWMGMEDYDEIISLNEKENELMLFIG